MTHCYQSSTKFLKIGTSLGKNGNCLNLQIIGTNFKKLSLNRAVHTSRGTTSLNHLHHFRKIVPIKPLSTIHGFEEKHNQFAQETSHGQGEDSDMSLKEQFSHHMHAHGSKSLSELIRAIFVFQFCQINFFVNNAETILKYSSKIFGTKFTNFMMRETFFKHFCGGENEQCVQSTISSLRKNGIQSILDYAAEDEVKGVSESESSTNSSNNSLITKPPHNQPARVYDYLSEEKCNSHVDTFLSCIRTAGNSSASDSGNAFAALKITALGNPLLLERMSLAITETKNLFAKFDKTKNGIITRDEFTEAYQIFFTDSEERLPSLLEALDPDGNNSIDYITWSQQLKPTDLPYITSSCRTIGPLALATPSVEEIDLMETMRDRVQTIANEAFICKTRLLIDAEQTRYQPAIDSIALELQREYNCTHKTEFPIIFNTYQCYLKDVLERLATDVKRSNRFSYHFAAKLVRGAYMVSERQRSRDLGVASPIFDTIDDTHKCYDDAIEFLLRYKTESQSKVELMCATHNQQSVEKAIELMRKFNIKPTDNTVHFAQLYGMRDNITYTLGNHGYGAYKYVPYGNVGEVMPYLLRRSQENSGMLQDSSNELGLLYNELKQRFSLIR